MPNELVDKGILTRSGDICKDKINLVAGAITKPFADMVWVMTNGDRETLNRLTQIFLDMNIPASRKDLFKIVQMFYGLMGIQFPDEAVLMSVHPKALEYFLFSFIADFGEIIKDYMDEEQGETAK